MHFVLLVALPKALMYIDLNLLNNHDQCNPKPSVFCHVVSFKCGHARMYSRMTKCNIETLTSDPIQQYSKSGCV